MSDAEDEADHDFAPDGSMDEAAGDSDADEPEPEPEPAETSVLYLVYNRQHYRTPKKEDSKPGWQRCYNRTVKVPTGKVLGQMIAGAEGWPRGEELATLVSADKIVVVMGKLKKEDTVLSPVWYLLVEVDDVTNKQDHQILRHIPKPVYKEVIDVIKKDPSMAESSLLRMQAHGENRQALNPELNSFAKVVKGEEPKSAAVMPERPKADPSKKRKADDSKAESSKAKKTDPAAAPSPSPAPTDLHKKPKQSVMSLWKQTKAPADGEAEEAAKAPAVGSEEAAKAPAVGSKEVVKPPPPAPTSEPSKKRKADDSKAESSYKKVRTATLDSWQVLLSEPGAVVEFTAPTGATSAKVNITWSFE
jgi:hypothetical protein